MDQTPGPDPRLLVVTLGLLAVADELPATLTLTAQVLPRMTRAPLYAGTATCTSVRTPVETDRWSRQPAADSRAS
jgi:hypothetical protein